MPSMAWGETSTRALTALVAVVMVCCSACASTTTPPPPRPIARPFDNVQRLAVVVSAESRFTVVEHNPEPGRTLDEVLGWIPSFYKPWMRPVAELVHRGITWLSESDSADSAGRSVAGISPTAAVAIAFERTLAATQQFQQIEMLEREPVGDDRQRLDAIVRLSVPSWGIVRVREGKPELVSGFADARAEMTIPGTGVVIWQRVEDVTDPDRLPLESLEKDPEFTRHQLLDVLTRAGQRLANELVYARSAGR
jgi:hypothetical protein